MRNISANGLAQLAQRLGTEPITIIEIAWGGSIRASYADRDVAGIPGRILEVSELDNVIDVTAANSSQEISIVLDDTQGHIKNILNAYDVHQRDVFVYQYFHGLNLADKFLLFQGKLSSPVVWSEGERTVSFTAVSQLEDKEFGFSAEEGQFPFLPKDMVGKAWPAIFGKVLDVPALQVNKAVSGTTLCGVGILSGVSQHFAIPLGTSGGSNGAQYHVANMQELWLRECSNAWQFVDPAKAFQLDEQAREISASVSKARAQENKQAFCARAQRKKTIDDAEGQLGCNPVRILGGEDFPQNTPMVLNINGGLFTGKMNNDSFTIFSRVQPEEEEQAEADAQRESEIRGCGESPPPPIAYSFSMDTPLGTIRRSGKVFTVLFQHSRPSIDQVAKHFWAEEGSKVVIASDEPITYIVSITPGQVLAVKAYKQFTGERRLVNVPSDLWTAQTVNYGPITAVQVVVNKPLSTIVDQGWDDDLYVTFESSIGPNTVDILEYIINNYTDLAFDTVSFNAVRTKVHPFPMNFPVLDRRNTIDVLKDIAFAARCAIWVSNAVVYLKYLPEEPTADSTIAVSDVQNKSVSMELTPTEDLVTKMIVTWRLSWADGNGEEPERIILRHNVKKYGTKEEEFDFSYFNQPDIVLKAATFWLIRKAHTWKKIKFSTFLNKLNLETFDTVELDLPPYVASSSVKAVVEKANYNSESNLIDFECWVPVQAGTMVKDPFAWPSALPITETFPSAQDIAQGNAGGDSIGSGATGQLPIGFTDGIGNTGTVFVGGPNVLFLSQSDRGDRTPTDIGFQAQAIIPGNVFAELTNLPRPRVNLKLNYTDPFTYAPTGVANDNTVIDIRKTIIVDSADEDAGPARLSSVIDSVKEGQLYLKTNIKVADEANEGEFIFKYDEESGKFGAETAFLQEDEEPTP